MPKHAWIPWALAVGVLGALFGPVVSWGPVAEDLQWAYKGWAAAHDPVAFLQPFHQHYRPLVLGFFSLASVVFSDRWWLFRLSSLGLGGVVLWVASAFLRSHSAVPAAVSAAVGVLWLASPLTNEVFFVTCEIQQIMYACGVLLALQARKAHASSLWVWVGALLALGSKEEAVVLPVLAALQDAVLFRLSWREVWRRTRNLGFATICFLAINRVVTGFEAGWFYQNLWLALPNLATTWTAFWHLHPPVLTDYPQILAEIWPKAAFGLAATAAIVVCGLRWQRFTLFSLLASAASLAPTLPAGVQSPRYMFLPYFFFLAGVASVVWTLLRRIQRWRAVAEGALVSLAIGVGANEFSLAWGDREDWRRFERLSAQLDREFEPVLQLLRGGKPVLLVRGNDDHPVWSLLRSPRGVRKLYFPRPDDPYGVVSASALASWKLRHEGLAARRELSLAGTQDPAVLIHETGGFVPAGPRFLNDQVLFGHGAVLLHPVPASTFNPTAFP